MSKRNRERRQQRKLQLKQGAVKRESPERATASCRAVANGHIQRDNEGKPIAVGVVNLLVTPEQAETLSLASNEMKIQLVLRNPLDKEVAKTPGTAVSNLFSGQSGLGALDKAAGPRPAPY